MMTEDLHVEQQEEPLLLYVYSLSQKCKDDLKDLSCLSSDERVVYQSFHSKKSQLLFYYSRKLLRQRLSHYLKIEPSLIEFGKSQFGKLQLHPKRNCFQVFFNLSHSENWIVLAFSRDRDVGVDIEWIRPIQSVHKFCERFFSNDEIQFLNKFSTEQQLRIFFKIWTAKEAYLKAKGVGLSESLRNFSVIRNGVYALSHQEQDLSWNLHHFKFSDKMVGTLCYPGKTGDVQLFQKKI